MPIIDILSQIDSQIVALQQARALLSGSSNDGAQSEAKSSSTSTGKKKRTISAEARARIAEAQRKRWAAQKKSK